MATPNLESIQTHSMLVTQRRALRELAAESRAVIASLAVESYGSIEELLPLPRLKLVPARLVVGNAHDRSLGPQYVLQRQLTLKPRLPVPGNAAYQIAATESEESVSQGYLLRGPAVFRDHPEQHVTMQLVRNPTDVGPQEASFSFGSHGTVTHNRFIEYTTMQKTIADPNAQFHTEKHYSSPEELADEYASRYTSALAVAGTMAVCLAAVHDTSYDIEPCLKLMTAWQQAAVSEAGAMSPALAPLIPKQIAA